MPPTVPINHYDGPRNQQNRTIVLFYYSMLTDSSVRLLWTLSFTQSNSGHSRRSGPWGKEWPVLAKSGPAPSSQNSTTSFLTATTLIYALGAGITAAAGTRLALQLFLVKVFTLYSFQLQDPKGPCIVIYCHYLPVSGLGNLRACCLPWMW